MRNKLTIVFTALCILAVVGLTGWTIYRLESERAWNAVLAERSFASLQNVLRSSYQDSDGGIDTYARPLGGIYRGNDAIDLIAVWDTNGLGALLPGNGPLLSPSAAAIGSSGIKHDSLFQRLETAKISVPDRDELTVSVLYTILPYKTVVSSLMTALIGLLSILVVASVLLLVSKPEEIPAEAFGGFGDIPESFAAENDRFEEESIFASDPPEVPEVPEDFETGRDKAGTEPSAKGGSGESLYSPASDVGWESYLPDRLTAELDRSASFEQDLVLMLIRIDGVTSEMPAYRKTADLLVDFFTFRDMIFEREKDGFAIILPNITVENGLRMANDFIRKAESTLETSSSGDRPISVGLSSRAGRLIRAATILKEAESALARVETEKGSTVVAFKPDVDRYRSFISSQT
jgi:hypothetical protein